jgi:tRNA(Arg) A34 adenosine deaminase TadA
MEAAIAEALRAEAAGSVPVGAAVVSDNKIVAVAGNKVIRNADPTAHAEILAIREACRFFGSHIVDKCDIYVTLEPCPMCLEAIFLSRMRRLYFGAGDTRRADIAVSDGFPGSGRAFAGTEIIGGVSETRCTEILRDFFNKKRN